jgi:H+-transporting ATPase
MDLVKFAMKYTVIKALQKRAAAKAHAAGVESGAPMQRTVSRHESLYSNRTSFLKTAKRRLGGNKVAMSANEQQRFGSTQVSQSGATLARNPSRT